jgi:hypothetical protein
VSDVKKLLSHLAPSRRHISQKGKRTRSFLFLFAGSRCALKDDDFSKPICSINDSLSLLLSPHDAAIIYFSVRPLSGLRKNQKKIKKKFFFNLHQIDHEVKSIYLCLVMGDSLKSIFFSFHY